MLAELITGRPQNADSYDLVTIYNEASKAHNGGGFFAGSLAYFSYKYLSLVGTLLLVLVLGIASLVIFTQHSFVGGIKKGGRKLIEKTRQETENYRDYAEKRRERLQERRERIEEEKRLAIEQKEDEKILRMEKKVSGVMLDTALDKADEEDEEVIHSDLDAISNKSVFIPEDEIHDDIHEIILNKGIETDIEPDGQRVMRTGPVIHGMG